MGEPLTLSGPLARNRQSLGAHAQAAHLRALRLDRRGADIRFAGTDRRRAQLGLPLQLDSGFVVDALRADASWLHSGSHRVHALARKPLSASAPRCFAPTDVSYPLQVPDAGTKARPL